MLPPYPYPPPREQSSLAVWALVCGIVGILIGWCLLGLPSIAAIVLGHMALEETKTGHIEGRGMAVAGLVMGYVAALPAILIFIFVVLGGMAGGLA
jgi:hypothetical protein